VAAFFLFAGLGVDEVLHPREKSTKLALAHSRDESQVRIKSMPAACLSTHPASRDHH
jgi:hypothetical protein